MERDYLAPWRIDAVRPPKPIPPTIVVLREDQDPRTSERRYDEHGNDVTPKRLEGFWKTLWLSFGWKCETKRAGSQVSIQPVVAAGTLNLPWATAGVNCPQPTGDERSEMTYAEWCQERNCTHGHCSLLCEHPQPLFVESATNKKTGETVVVNDLVCGRCFHFGQITAMVPCEC